jgi:WD40 repeat protein
VLAVFALLALIGIGLLLAMPVTGEVTLGHRLIGRLPGEPLGTAHRKLAHNGEVWWLAFSPDSRHLVSGGTDGVKVWTTDGTLRLTLRGVGGARYPSGAFSPDSRTYVLGSSAGLHEVTLAPPYRIRGIEVHRDSIRRLAVQVVAVRNGMAVEVRNSSVNATVAFVPLDAPALAVVHPVEGGNAGGGYAAMNRLVVVARNIGNHHARPGRIWLFDLDRPKAAPILLYKGGGHPSMLSPDGRYFAINLYGKLTLFDLDTQEKRWAVASPGGGLAAVGFTPGNRWLFAGHHTDNRITLDVETGRERWREPVEFGQNGAWFSAVSPSLGMIVVAREADRLELLDLDLQHVAFLGYPHQYGWTSVPSALETSPDGKWAAIAYNGRVHLWDLVSREPTYLIDPRIKKR